MIQVLSGYNTYFFPIVLPKMIWKLLMKVKAGEILYVQDNGVACVPSYRSQATPAVSNSTQFYNVYVTVPDCFYGQVGTDNLFEYSYQ